MRLSVLVLGLIAAAPALAQETPAPDAAAQQTPTPAEVPPETDAAQQAPDASPTPPPAVAAPAFHDPSGLAEGTLVRITLADGQLLRGVLVRSEAEQVVVRVGEAGEVAVSRAVMKTLEAERHAEVRKGGELWFQDPNRTRYLYSPSAVMLRKGEGYFSQKELLFSSVAYGVTDNVTLVAGTMVPAWFAPDGQGINFIGGVKVGGEVAENLHLAAGAESLVLPAANTGGAGVGFVFGTATYEWPTLQLSLSAGRPFLLGGAAGWVPQVIFVPSASWRVAKNVSLVTENWVMPFQQRTLGWDSTSQQPITRNDGFTLLNSLAARFFGEQWSADVGLIRMQTHDYVVPVPIPWLDFTYHFK